MRSNSGTAESKDSAGSDWETVSTTFGETWLNILTESSLRQNKAKEATAIMELNLEVNTPPSSWALSLAGMRTSRTAKMTKPSRTTSRFSSTTCKDRFARTQLDNLLNSNP